MEKAKITKELYEEYCHGNIKFCDIIKKLNISRFELEKQFKENNFLHRRNVLKNTTKHDFFEKIDSELKSYLLGFYVADGCIYNDYFSISLTEQDKEIVQLFQNTIGPYFKITYSPEYLSNNGYVSKPLYSISIHSKQICETLEKYGIGANKTTTSNFNFSVVPESLMIHFIRGYFDGDGVVCATTGIKNQNGKKYKYNNYNWSIISNKKENLTPIQEFLFNSFNIKSNILNDGRGHFLIEINKKDDFFLMRKILYNNANYFLKRKKDKFFSIQRTPDKIKKIVKLNEKKEIVETYKNLNEAGKKENVTGACIKLRIKKNLIINGFSWDYLKND